MQTSRIIDGETFELVSRARELKDTDLLLYKGTDSYLRIGDKGTLERTLAIHHEMQSAGFPVPKILKEGIHEDVSYFIEESLGDKTFRVLFDEDTASLGRISDVHFGNFIAIAERYLSAQVKNIIPEDPDSFALGIRLDALCEQLPEYAQLLRERFAKTLEDTGKLPYVISHGDLGPANMYPGGIIDLEDSTPAPFGFDAVGTLTTVDWYPKTSNYEFFSRYEFSPEQRSDYFDMCDRIATSNLLPSISSHADDFDFCRGIWLCEGMQAWPNTAKWKYQHMIEKYLS